MSAQRCTGGFDGCRPDEAKLVNDPYDEEVHEEQNPRWLCPVCYQELCWEI